MAFKVPLSKEFTPPDNHFTFDDIDSLGNLEVFYKMLGASKNSFIKKQNKKKSILKRCFYSKPQSIKIFRKFCIPQLG